MKPNILTLTLMTVVAVGTIATVASQTTGAPRPFSATRNNGDLTLTGYNAFFRQVVGKEVYFRFQGSGNTPARVVNRSTGITLTASRQIEVWLVPDGKDSQGQPTWRIRRSVLQGNVTASSETRGSSTLTGTNGTLEAPGTATATLALQGPTRITNRTATGTVSSVTTGQQLEAVLSQDRKQADPLQTATLAGPVRIEATVSGRNAGKYIATGRSATVRGVPARREVVLRNDVKIVSDGEGGTSETTGIEMLKLLLDANGNLLETEASGEPVESIVQPTPRAAGGRPKQ